MASLKQIAELANSLDARIERWHFAKNHRRRHIVTTPRRVSARGIENEGQTLRESTGRPISEGPSGRLASRINVVNKVTHAALTDLLQFLTDILAAKQAMDVVVMTPSERHRVSCFLVAVEPHREIVQQFQLLKESSFWGENLDAHRYEFLPDLRAFAQLRKRLFGHHRGDRTLMSGVRAAPRSHL